MKWKTYARYLSLGTLATIFLFTAPFRVDAQTSTSTAKSTDTTASVPPSSQAFYTLESGKFYITYPGNFKVLLSISPSPLMKSGIYYVRTKNGVNFDYYENYSDHTTYGLSYHIPYEVLNLKIRTSFSGTDFDNMVKNSSSSSPLIGWGSSFKKAETTYGVNGLYLLAHAVHESGWGTSQIATNKKNLFGFQAYDSNPYGYATSFANFEDCILYVTNYVNQNYLSINGRYYKGPNLEGMNVYYATDPLWADGIDSLMQHFYSFNPNHTVHISSVPNPSFQAKAFPSPYTFITVSNPNGIDVYTNPDSTSAIKTHFAPGTIYVDRGHQNGYAQVMLQDKTFGWVILTS